MARTSHPTRIIAQSSGPDVVRLRALVRELRRRVRDMAMRGAPLPAGNTDLATLTLWDLCRAAIEALNPDGHKLYLGRSPRAT